MAARRRASKLFERMKGEFHEMREPHEVAPELASGREGDGPKPLRKRKKTTRAKSKPPQKVTRLAKKAMRAADEFVKEAGRELDQAEREAKKTKTAAGGARRRVSPKSGSAPGPTLPVQGRLAGETTVVMSDDLVGKPYAEGDPVEVSQPKGPVRGRIGNPKGHDARPGHVHVMLDRGEKRPVGQWFPQSLVRRPAPKGGT